MSLSLPADAEKFIPEGNDYDHLRSAGVYALTLGKPDDLAEAWDAEFDARPPYFDDLRDAAGVVYVGEAGDVLRRLEEHRDGDTRVGVLQRVCAIEGLRNIWWCDDKDHAEQQESVLAIALQNERPGLYVHFR